jgi:hypothetical protein
MALENSSAKGMRKMAKKYEFFVCPSKVVNNDSTPNKEMFQRNEKTQQITIVNVKYTN